MTEHAAFTEPEDLSGGSTLEAQVTNAFLDDSRPHGYLMLAQSQPGPASQGRGEQVKERAQEIGSEALDGAKKLGGFLMRKGKDIANSREVSLVGKFTRDAFNQVRDFTQIEKLDLSRNPSLTDADLGSLLPRMLNLGSLNLSHNAGITDAGLTRHLSSNRNLKSLNLENTLINGAVLSLFPALPIAQLVLKQNPRLNPAELGNLSRIPGLQMLDLSNNPQIDDRSLATLKKLTNVKELDLRGTGLTDQKINELRAALPNARIRH